MRFTKRGCRISLDHSHGIKVFGFTVALTALSCLTLAGSSIGQTTGVATSKTFIDYFLPIPITSPLASNVWGAPGVLPARPEERPRRRDHETMVLLGWTKSSRGRTANIICLPAAGTRPRGHGGWFGSQAVHAVSDKATGPYVDKGLCWPDNQGGKGHNVTALVLPDGRYAVVVSETRPGDVFVSNSLDGPWKYLGSIQVAANEFSGLGRMSNVSIMVRPDGDFEIVPRSGAILISKTGILGPYTVQGPSIYPKLPGLPHHLHNLEDPVVWFSGGLYHIVVNSWSNRKAYHLTSPDGITDWKFQGLAYDPTKDFVRYTDGTVNHWNKMERPNVYLENGHVPAVTLAVIDVPKDEEKGNDMHGSKIIVIPFDGAALDRDLQHASRSFIRPAEIRAGQTPSASAQQY